MSAGLAVMRAIARSSGSLPVQRRADHERGEDVDAGESGGGLPDVVPPRLLVGGGERGVVGGDGVDGPVAHAFP